MIDSDLGDYSYKLRIIEMKFHESLDEKIIQGCKSSF